MSTNTMDFINTETHINPEQHPIQDQQEEFNTNMNNQIPVLPQIPGNHNNLQAQNYQMTTNDEPAQGVGGEWSSHEPNYSHNNNVASSLHNFNQTSLIQQDQQQQQQNQLITEQNISQVLPLQNPSKPSGQRPSSVNPVNDETIIVSLQNNQQQDQVVADSNLIQPQDQNLVNQNGQLEPNINEQDQQQKALSTQMQQLTLSNQQNEVPVQSKKTVENPEEEQDENQVNITDFKNVPDQNNELVVTNTVKQVKPKNTQIKPTIDMMNLNTPRTRHAEKPNQSLNEAALIKQNMVLQKEKQEKQKIYERQQIITNRQKKNQIQPIPQDNKPKIDPSKPYDLITTHENNNDKNVRCDICLDSDDDEDDEIVICEKCLSACHQKCYGGELQDGLPKAEFYCTRCKILEHKPEWPCNKIKCSLCPDLKGIIRPIGEKNNTSWAHVTCINWIPEVWYLDGTKKNKIGGGVPKARFDLTCFHCKIKSGACIQCDYKDCTAAVHVRCAIELKMIDRWDVMNTNLGIEDSQGGLEKPIFCPKHAQIGNETYKSQGQKGIRSGRSKLLRFNGVQAKLTTITGKKRIKKTIAKVTDDDKECFKENSKTNKRIKKLNVKAIDKNEQQQVRRFNGNPQTKITNTKDQNLKVKLAQKVGQTNIPTQKQTEADLIANLKNQFLKQRPTKKQDLNVTNNVNAKLKKPQPKTIEQLKQSKATNPQITRSHNKQEPEKKEQSKKQEPQQSPESFQQMLQDNGMQGMKQMMENFSGGQMDQNTVNNMMNFFQSMFGSGVNAPQAQPTPQKNLNQIQSVLGVTNPQQTTATINEQTNKEDHEQSVTNLQREHQEQLHPLQDPQNLMQLDQMNQMNQMMIPGMTDPQMYMQQYPPNAIHQPQFMHRPQIMQPQQLQFDMAQYSNGMNQMNGNPAMYANADELMKQAGLMTMSPQQQQVHQQQMNGVMQQQQPQYANGMVDANGATYPMQF